MAQTDLIAQVNSTSPRERTGSQTAARYDFQTNFGILKLIELQETEPDFRMVFDLFDDIVVLDSADAPQHLRLYQVKSKDPGDWTSTELCAKKGSAAPRSIMSRLYSHMNAFGSWVTETGFVSNAAFRVKLSDGTTTTGIHHYISGANLHNSEIEKITKTIDDEITPNDIPAWLPKLALIRITLGVHGQELVVLGRLQQHIEDNHGVAGVKTRALYDTLHETITHRTTLVAQGVSNADLLIRKSLTKQDLQDLLSTAVNRRSSYLEDWEAIRADLIQAGVGSADQVRLRTLCVAYGRDLTSGRPNATKLKDHIDAWVTQNTHTIQNCTSLLSLVNTMQQFVPSQIGYAGLELRAALIVEAHEAINGST